MWDKHVAGLNTSIEKWSKFCGGPTVKMLDLQYVAKHHNAKLQVGAA